MVGCGPQAESWGKNSRTCVLRGGFFCGDFFVVLWVLERGRMPQSPIALWDFGVFWLNSLFAMCCVESQQAVGRFVVWLFGGCEEETDKWGQLWGDIAGIMHADLG